MFFLKKSPWTGLAIALMSIPALVVFSAYNEVDMDNEAQVIWAIKQEGIILAIFVVAATVLTYMQHQWSKILKFFSRFPRSLLWGRGVMLLSIIVLPFMPSKIDTDGELTVSSLLIGMSVIFGFIIAGIVINAVQYPEEAKKFIKDMFSV